MFLYWHDYRGYHPDSCQCFHDNRKYWEFLPIPCVTWTILSKYIVHYVVAILVYDGTLIVFIYISLYIFNNSFCLSDDCFWIWQCCLTSSVNLSVFIYLSIDIKKNSENIWPNVPMCHFGYEQWPISPCCIFSDMRINTYICRKSNEGYVTVKL